MSQYTKEVLKIVVAKICQTIGWHGIQTTPLEIMVDILRRYITQVAVQTHAYSEQYGHTQPTLDTLGLAFREMHINLSDLEEYVRYVDSSPAIDVPEFPIHKESHLNFLKPGSSEVVTRPVHIHEHLPPMLPKVEESDTAKISNHLDDVPPFQNTDTGYVFKRPADISPVDSPNKRPRWCTEEEGRPTREISSVMMTTSGFLSPAREGRLPEARTPMQAVDHSLGIMSPQQSTPNSEIRHGRRTPNRLRDGRKDDKRKDKTSKELFKPMLDDLSTRKNILMKDVMKNKILKGNAVNNNHVNLTGVSSTVKTNQIKPVVPAKVNKTQQKVNKSEKVPPAPSLPTQKIFCSTPGDKVVEGKLSSEPDKLKQNILKKISRVKDDKVEKIDKLKKDEAIIPEEILESRESSPDLIIDETTENKNSEIIKNLNNPVENLSKNTELIEKPLKTTNVIDVGKPFEMKSPHSEKDFMYDDDISPPGTPSIPKTPEMVSNSPPQKVEKEVKRKRKDKNKVKSKAKVAKHEANVRRFKPEVNDTVPDCPKTPDDPISATKDEEATSTAAVDPPFFPFFTPFSSGPGLIPVGNPLFPRLPMPVALNKPGFGQPAHISPTMPVLPFTAPMKPAEEIHEKPAISSPQEQTIKVEKLDFDVSISKEKHKKDKKDKIKKKNKKDKVKNKSEKKKIKEEKKEKDKIKKEKKDKKKEKEREHEGSVPKILLKIGSPRPTTPDPQLARKIMIKPVIKMNDEPQPSTSQNLENTEKREPSPELARISALITRPPKLKIPTNVIDKSPKSSPSPADPSSQFHAKLKKNLFRSIPKIKTRDLKKYEDTSVSDLCLTQNPPHINVQPYYTDNEGTKIWICPACGRQDDGSPMIGCDDCDAWYHWVCVGIQIPPDDNEDWYCRPCIVKKKEILQVDKKKKRKKKDRKEHT